MARDRKARSARKTSKHRPAGVSLIDAREAQRRVRVEKHKSRAQLRYDPQRLAAYQRADKDAIDDGAELGAELAINERQLTTWAQRDTVLGNGQDTLSFHFLRQFAVADLHIQELLRGPMLHHKLEDFRAGSLSLGTCQISDHMAMRLARACPNLKQVRLVGACRLTDMALAALVEFCLDIEYIEISGSEEESGKISTPSRLRRLRNPDQSKWGRVLCRMVLCNQDNLDLESCKELTEVHSGLELILGNTASNRLNLMTYGQITNLVRTKQKPEEDLAQGGTSRPDDDPPEHHPKDYLEDYISDALGGMTLDDAGDVVMD